MAKRKSSPTRRGKKSKAKSGKPARKVAGSRRKPAKAKRAKSKRAKRKPSAAASTQRAARKAAPAKASPRTTRPSSPQPPTEAPPPNPLASEDRGRRRTEHDWPVSPTGVHPQPDVERVVAVTRRRSLRPGTQH
ncbi:MAG TPA: hypothetical protein VFY71_10745 [Planctomycetota bacterium]|nr:hypothetical protein [Planctomycetota bacterium]